MTTPDPDAPALLLIGAGDSLYRGYALKTLASRYPILLLDTEPPTWQNPYIADHRVADLGDLTALRAAADDLAAAHEIGGVLTWNEFAVAHTAAIAQHLKTAGLDPEAVRACRNKAVARALFDAHAVPSARWAPVNSPSQLRTATAHLGYPFVLKPAAAAGSAGVIRIDSPDELGHAYAFAARAAGHHGVTAAGLVAEEYLDGPEISIEVVAGPGGHTVAAVTHKQLGTPPYFEETGHLVAPALRSSVTDEAEKTAIRALEALDITHGVAHVEIRLTSAGPRLIEVNPRLGGDLIPHLVHLATGIDLVTAAADLAMGLDPAPRATRHQAAGIGFVYPKTAGRLLSLTADPALTTTSWCERAVLEQQSGARIAPPPASGLDSRLAHAVVTADTPAQCRQRLDHALTAIHATIDTTPAHSGETVAA
ncbi:ATP-grasp domain-containing protein [Streptomyces sp. NPDC002215]|uniref:ATP-grasp domain-containing protein n=1 Tax=Streptomyces sp. NPDC002215 TaxID=3154412 RepID=UPI00332843B1